MIRRFTSWFWFARRFGARRAYRYWQAGRVRGWMTDEQSREVLDQLRDDLDL